MINRNIFAVSAAAAALLLASGGSVFGQLGGPDKNKALTFPPLRFQDVTPFPNDLKLDEQVQKVIDGFFDLLQQDHVELAYDQLVRGTKIAEKPEEVATLKSKTNEAINVYGDIVGKEVVSVQNVGTHLLRATILSLGKNYPLRWRFYFYRDDKSWRLIDIRVDDRLVDMFDEKPSSSGADQK